MSIQRRLHFVTIFLSALALWALIFSANICAGEAVESHQLNKESASYEMVDLWFFWSEKCPHCKEAHPHVVLIADEMSRVRLHSLRIDGQPENIQVYQKLAQAIGREARSVPAFIFCDQMLVGWDDNGVVEQSLRDGLVSCLADGVSLASTQPLVLPFIGEIDPEAWSLPAFTITIAALDSFNPCAFFVLLFLLSLLVHAGSRARMLVIGGFFILISGIVYFTAMAAWLNLFTLVGHLPLVTLVAGLLAITISLINVKDYFWFKRGASLTMSDRNRGKLMNHMRNMLAKGSLPTMLAATLSLALAANLYELLCTAGFPMVYTRFLTLNELGTAEYYFYLLLYNFVYVVPLLLIMIAFVFTLGQRKLQEHEGRILKLLSGIMMLVLGMLLLFAPGALSQLWIVVLMLAGSVGATWIIVKIAPPGLSGTGS